MNKTVKHVFLLGFGILLPLLLLEGILQVAAYVTYRRAVGEAEGIIQSRRSGKERMVLCVGDSFTYGSGASSRATSYPGRLQALLNREEDGLTWRVVNRGWPGRNSSELLQRLPGLLVKEKPDYVCVLIGANNLWSRAEMDRPPPTLENGRTPNVSWQWKLRTVRLLQIGLARLAGTNVKEPPPRQSRPPSPPKKKPPRNKKLPTGKPEYRRLLEAEGHLKKHEIDEVNRILDELHPRVRALHDRALALKYLEILYGLRRYEEVIQEAFFDIKKYGKTLEFCFLLVEPLARMGRLEEALSFANEAIRLQKPGHEKAGFYNTRALVYKLMKNDPLQLRDYFHAYALDRDANTLETNLLRMPGLKDDLVAGVPGTLKALSLDPEIEKEITETLARVLEKKRNKNRGEGSRIAGKLAEDLRCMADLIQAAGARMILLTYPEPVREVDAALRAFARKADIPLVDAVARFARILEREDRNDYFIADGHCTDAGYALVAEETARVLRVLEKNRGPLLDHPARGNDGR